MVDVEKSEHPLARLLSWVRLLQGFHSKGTQHPQTQEDKLLPAREAQGDMVMLECQFQPNIPLQIPVSHSLPICSLTFTRETW